MLKICSYEIQGKTHQTTDTVCQDKTFSLVKNSTTSIALADGAGSAQFSDVGAIVAVETICEYFSDNFKEVFDNNDGIEVKRNIIMVIRGALEEKSKEIGCKITDLASTLLSVAINNNSVIAVHIGDGLIGYVKDDNLKVVSQPITGEYLNETTFVTSSDALSNMVIVKGNTTGISGFVLMSDGSAESFYNRNDKTIAPAVKRLIEGTAILTEKVIYQQIHKIFTKIITKKTGDDCSIAIIAFTDVVDIFKLDYRNLCILLHVDYNNLKHSKKLVKNYLRIIKQLVTDGDPRSVSKKTQIDIGNIKKKLRYLESIGIVVNDRGAYRLSNINNASIDKNNGGCCE